jgi:hypothetical protein
MKKNKQKTKKGKHNMKITTFNPMILTKKPEEAIALFEALGIVVL